MKKKRTQVSSEKRQQLLQKIRGEIAKGANVTKATAAHGVKVATYYSWIKNSAPKLAERKPVVLRRKRAASQNAVHFSSGLPSGQILVAIGEAKEVQRTLELLARR